MRDPSVEARIRQQHADRRRTLELRRDKRDPRKPLPAPEAAQHPMGGRVCTTCGLTYPWRSYATRAGMVSQCLPCREQPT